MNSEEILHLIGGRIRQLYQEPQMCVGDAGELNSVLFELHWLYAHATGSLEGFVESFRNQGKDRFLQRLQFANSHSPLCDPGVADEVVNWWRHFDNSLEWNWPNP